MLLEKQTRKGGRRLARKTVGFHSKSGKSSVSVQTTTSQVSVEVAEIGERGTLVLGITS